MSLSDSFLKGLSREAVTVVSLLTYDSSCLSLEDIQHALPWMPPERVAEALDECLKHRLFTRAQRADGTTTYFID
jgi:hypothetical protein